VWFTVDFNGGAFMPTLGNHRDLGVADVAPGTVITIPEPIGSFSTSIAPIQLDTPKGVVGLVLVLMNDGGHVTPQGIAAGHDTFNQEVANLINDLIPQAIGPNGLTQFDIDQAVANANIAEKVSQAVQSAQSLCENLWALSGADSEIGHVVATFDVGDFANPSQTKSFELQVGNPLLNKWVVQGTITMSDQCPATVSASLLANVFDVSAAASKAEPQASRGAADMKMFLGLLRDFRVRKALLKEKSFADWWNLVKQHTPELACKVATRRDVQEAILPLISELGELIRNDERRLSIQFIAGCEGCLTALQHGASNRLSKDLRTVFSLLPRLRDRTLHEALRIAATRRVNSKLNELS
jgi:hypothetical protein